MSVGIYIYIYIYKYISKTFGLGKGRLFPCCYDFKLCEITARGDWKVYITDMISFQVKYIKGTLDVDVISLKEEHSF